MKRSWWVSACLVVVMATTGCATEDEEEKVESTASTADQLQSSPLDREEMKPIDTPRGMPTPWPQPDSSGIFDTKGKCGPTAVANTLKLYGIDDVSPEEADRDGVHWWIGTRPRDIEPEPLAVHPDLVLPARRRELAPDDRSDEQHLEVALAADLIDEVGLEHLTERCDATSSVHRPVDRLGELRDGRAPTDEPSVHRDREGLLGYDRAEVEERAEHGGARDRIDMGAICAGERARAVHIGLEPACDAAFGDDELRSVGRLVDQAVQHGGAGVRCEATTRHHDGVQRPARIGARRREVDDGRRGEPPSSGCDARVDLPSGEPVRQDLCAGGEPMLPGCEALEIHLSGHGARV